MHKYTCLSGHQRPVEKKASWQVKTPNLWPVGCHHPSKHVGSDLEVFWSWQVMAITASVLPELSLV